RFGFPTTERNEHDSLSNCAVMDRPRIGGAVPDGDHDRNDGRSAGKAAARPRAGGHAANAHQRQLFANVISPPEVPTLNVSPAGTFPARISRASGFSICCWIARLSGRAP